MVDTKLSALPQVAVPADLDELYVNDGGVSKRLTFSDLILYIESRGRQNNASVANQGAGFAVDTYLTGSEVLIPTGRLQAKSMYRCRFNVTKTAAGTATPIVQVRFGTAGSTADVSRASMTFPAQTAAVDDGMFEVFVVFRTLGAAGVVQAVAQLKHRQSVTGLATLVSPSVATTSAGFDTTVASSRIGVSVNGGTSAAWTANLVQAELFNLA